MLKYTLNSDVSISWGNDFIKISGPKGIIIKRKSDFSLTVDNLTLYLWSEQNPSLEGAYLSWIHQLIIGVTKGYQQKLRLVGVGFKANLTDNILTLKIGYSHEIVYNVPKDIKITPSKNKGILLLVEGLELQRVKQTSVEIRNFRKPDSYKGKGIHYYGEILKLKKGKREGK